MSTQPDILRQFPQQQGYTDSPYAGRDLTEQEEQEVVKRYLEFQKESSLKNQHPDHEVWEIMNELMYRGNEQSLKVLFMCIDQATNKHQLAAVGAGPIEDLLLDAHFPQKQREIIISRIAQRAEHGPKTCYAIATSWIYRHEGFEKLTSIPLVRKFMKAMYEEGKEPDTSAYGF